MFYRFGQSGIRLDQVAAIRDITAAPLASDEPAALAVKVIFLGSGSEVFTGADAGFRNSIVCVPSRRPSTRNSA